MTNPRPETGPAASLPATTNGAATEQTVKTRPKTPRRASAPAGAPAKTAVPALLVVDAAGMIVPAPLSTHDAGDSPVPQTAPAAEVQVGNETPTASVTATHEGAADVQAEADVQTQAQVATDAEVADPAAGHAPTPSDAVGVEAEPDLGVAPEPAGDIAPDDAADIVVPAERAQTTPADPEVDEEGRPGEEPLPLSRRERRLAEQQLGSAVVPSHNETAAAPTTPPEPTVGEQPANPAKPAKKRGRFIAVVRGFFFLLVISAVILGLGTVLSDTADNHPGPSKTEVDRQAAWDATNSLLEQAAGLNASANKPAVQELLAQTAADLAAQGAALSDGLPSATATASPTAPVPATVEALVLGLSTNGEALLEDAVGAEHAMGRVFAAVGTSQLLRSQAVAAAADLTPVTTPALPASVNFPAPDAPECNSTLAPRPGVSVDAALLAAAEGEQKVIYAYQVAMPHLSENQLKRGTQLLARHEGKLTSLNAELEVRCLPRTALVPGFTLDASFTAHPAAALATLEGELAAVFADLAAVSPAPSTATATTGTALAAGVPSANTTQLREMAVAWLLDSADAQAGWGGRVGALAGMDSDS